jgi:hypothetical protein
LVNIDRLPRPQITFTEALMKLTHLMIDAAAAEGGAWRPAVGLLGIEFRVRGVDNLDWRRLNAKLMAELNRRKVRFGWGTWIRTKIDGVRVRCSTVELSPNEPASRVCRLGWSAHAGRAS